MRNKLAVLLAGILFIFTSSAFACETCPWDPYMQVYHCVSGEGEGRQWCYGGFPNYCEMDGKCGPPLSPSQSIDQFCVSGVVDTSESANCKDDGPGGGFVLSLD